ncbi:hypothetical protein M569_17484, partial [Genlisea aurea]
SSATHHRQKPHAVCVPLPTQGHIKPMLTLAKLLHHSGFFITFVNTHHTHRRLVRSSGIAAVDGFRFASIPDGLPPLDPDRMHEIPALCRSVSENCLEPLCELVEELNGEKDSPPVSCIVTDGLMCFGLKAAERFGVPGVVFWTASACGLVVYKQLRRLVDAGIAPLK